MAGVELVLMTTSMALLAGLWLLQRALRHAIVERSDPPRLRRYPSLTVIRPIKGVDVGIEQNVRAALCHGYPGVVETIFVFDDEQDPAVPFVRRALDEHGEEHGAADARILYCGAPPARRTGKLHAMITALREARGEMIVFADSDIRPAEGALEALVATLCQSPEIGSAFAPVVVQSAPETIGDAGYALLLNGMYGPAAELAARQNRERLPFIMGQMMVLSRAAIDAIGGLEAAEGQFVDDMALGALIARVGYANVVSPRRVPIIQRGVSTRAFFGIYRRWLTFGRTGLPDWRFKLPPALQGAGFWSGLLLAVLALALGQWAAFGLAALAVLYAVHGIVALHARLGGAAPSWRCYAGACVVLLVAPVIVAAVHLQHGIEWRGRRYDLDTSSHLAGEH